MIRFEISKALAKPLAAHIRPPAGASSQGGDLDLLWRADVALIGTELCVVAQEQYTQYIMVLCGLRSEDFANFPRFFTDRFWREASAICKQAGVYDSMTLAKQLQLLANPQYYQLEAEPLEEGRLTKTIEKLERIFLYEGQPLPVEGKAAFEFSFAINSKKTATEQQVERPSAAEALGNLCLSLIETNLAEAAQSRPSSNENVVSIKNNIVTVDFGRQR